LHYLSGHLEIPLLSRKSAKGYLITSVPLHTFLICFLSGQATPIDVDVKKAVKDICEIRGLKNKRFIEDALIDELERSEDLEDLTRIRFEASRSLGDVLKDLETNAKI
jgi:hypothetical protein